LPSRRSCGSGRPYSNRIMLGEGNLRLYFLGEVPAGALQTKP
jgi:hypothetical protein